jgi:hypothetical protein
MKAPSIQWQHEQRYANDGREWSELDLANLEFALRHGGTVDETAALLCRAGTIDEVRRKALELGIIRREP